MSAVVDLPAHELTLLTKDRVRDVISQMRLMGGAPASDKMKDEYTIRLCGLIKHDALAVIDQLEEFRRIMRVDDRSATSSIAYVKVLNQFIQTLLHTGQLRYYSRGDLTATASAYRKMSQ
ncbi:hypothetical protein HDV00_009354 [Rhizophlyctis rosea]|nr:hypothetical protein HDV00_009354 [Rhizophlyctis rosea]